MSSLLSLSEIGVLGGMRRPCRHHHISRRRDRRGHHHHGYHRGGLHRGEDNHVHSKNYYYSCHRHYQHCRKHNDHQPNWGHHDAHHNHPQHSHRLSRLIPQSKPSSVPFHPTTHFGSHSFSSTSSSLSPLISAKEDKNAISSPTSLSSLSSPALPRSLPSMPSVVLDNSISSPLSVSISSTNLVACHKLWSSMSSASSFPLSVLLSLLSAPSSQLSATSSLLSASSSSLPTSSSPLSASFSSLSSPSSSLPSSSPPSSSSSSPTLPFSPASSPSTSSLSLSSSSSRSSRSPSSSSSSLSSPSLSSPSPSSLSPLSPSSLSSVSPPPPSTALHGRPSRYIPKLSSAPSSLSSLSPSRPLPAFMPSFLSSLSSSPSSSSFSSSPSSSSFSSSSQACSTTSRLSSSLSQAPSQISPFRTLETSPSSILSSSTASPSPASSSSPSPASPTSPPSTSPTSPTPPTSISTTSTSPTSTSPLSTPPLSTSPKSTSTSSSFKFPSKGNEEETFIGKNSSMEMAVMKMMNDLTNSENLAKNSGVYTPIFSEWSKVEKRGTRTRKSEAQNELDLGGRQKKSLSIESVPESIKTLQYAVRGPIVSRSEEIQKKLMSDKTNFSFDEIVSANIGNPQALGQKPLTFNRMVAACLTWPDLLQAKENFTPIIPIDVVERVKRYMTGMPNIGSYSHSKGIGLFRDDISEWFRMRDGGAADPDHIFLTDGASEGVRLVIEMMIGDERDGLMIPIPQYPLYSASITRFKGKAVPYFLNEEEGWSLPIESLRESLIEAHRRGIRVKALTVINPGNPTGALLSRPTMEQILNFCADEGLVLLADEVYQENVYVDTAFTSFRRVAVEMNSPVQLFSFHSSSKGLTGECGLRGGLLHAHNIPNDVIEQIYKLQSISLCANTVGQAMMTSILSPPQPGDDSYESYNQERQLNAIEGISCQPVQGAMYAFPSIQLPPGVYTPAKERGIQPDLLYCLELLENEGFVVVPGSGFGQKKGTWHFRMTILPPEEKLEALAERLRRFNEDFHWRYRK